MQLTTNYKLKKPEGSDVVNVQDFNDNADILDNALATHTHDDRYYTESEINSKINTINNNISQLSNPNLLINGDFQVKEHKYLEKTFTNQGKYIVDRWVLASEHDIPAYARFRNNDFELVFTEQGNTSSNFRYYFEVEDVKKWVGKTLTYSLEYKSEFTRSDNWKKRDIDVFSSPNNAVNVTLLQHKHFTLDDGYARKEVTFRVNSVDDSITKFHIQFLRGSGYGTLFGYHHIRFVKLEYGDKATPFTPRLYSEELALCQRYYEVLSSPKTYATGISMGNNMAEFNILLNSVKRVRPSVIFSSPTAFVVGAGNNRLSYTATMTSLESDTDRLLINCTTKEAIFTSGEFCVLGRNDNEMSAIYVDAEIY